MICNCIDHYNVHTAQFRRIVRKLYVLFVEYHDSLLSETI